jgi:pyruvate/2-oxoglutarate dehydrogenase complex dihydrolipoamide dehydrogenase (E3) component
VAHYARHADVWGVQTGAVRVDLPSVVARKDRIVNQWRSGVERKIADRKSLHLYRGAARFTASHRLRVNGEEIELRRQRGAI